VPEVGITVSDATISLRILARAASRAEAQAQIEPVERTIRERLGELVFGVGGEEVQDAGLGLLAPRRGALAGAGGGRAGGGARGAGGRGTLAGGGGVRGGGVAGRLAGVRGASAWFRGGVVAYDNRLKVELLAVPQRLIDEHGAVSAAVAEAMAVGCRTRFRTDLAVSTVGIAGPGGGSTDKPVGLVYVGLASAARVPSNTLTLIRPPPHLQTPPPT